MIERSVFEEYGKAYPELLYTPDHVREGEFKQGEQIMLSLIVLYNDQNRYLSEDYMFSEYCRKIGIDIWALPMIELLHSGGYTFEGKMIDMAYMGVKQIAT